MPIPSINIFSGASTEFGAALTNPTELALTKKCVSKRYSVVFDGKLYADAEAAYKLLRSADAATNDALMGEVIASKLTQHPELLSELNARGGASFIKTCSHLTGARTERAQSWEGVGLESRFIRNLLLGYQQAMSKDLTQNQQRALF